MKRNLELEKCLTFINCHLQTPAQRLGLSSSGAARRGVTLSRQTGAGGHTVAELLLEYLQARNSDGQRPWTVFDRNLVEEALEEHHLSKRLAKFMPEDRTTEMSDTMDELFGLHPPSWTLVQQTAETILHLAERGNVILVGRGAHVITARKPYMFHVRLVGSLRTRVARIVQDRQVSPLAALDFIRQEDRGRRRYLRKYFNQNIDDPLLYHLVINTDFVSIEEAARMIGEAVLGRPDLKPSIAVSA
jgi:Cytidylate kinase-like family